MDNPEILVRDERLYKLDSIVNEVTESEEWEKVSMSIYTSALEHGQEIGKEIGKEIGHISHRTEQICKKLRKGKSLEIIADELEEDIEVTRPLYELALKFAPGYDENAVLDAWTRIHHK